MAKQAFKSWNPKDQAAERVAICNQIIRNYSGQGYRLTLRQLYYQLVSKNIIANTEREYKGLGTVVSRARLAGMMDWDAIEDRVRVPWNPPEYADLNELVRAALHSYRKPRWNKQKVYAELWVEKDALAGVLRPLASKFHATMMVNRGYSSQSAMYESAMRIGENAERIGAKETFIFYLGDLDPSGEDMVRDIQDRLNMFGLNTIVKKIALTMEQVKQHNPPPNPAKVTDSRAKAYIRKYGSSSWEVDALSPPILNQLIEETFAEVIDVPKMDIIKEEEREDKEALEQAVEKLLEARPPKEDEDDDYDEDDEEEYFGLYRCPNCLETYNDRFDVDHCETEKGCPGWEDEDDDA